MDHTYDVAIDLRSVSKKYQIYGRPSDRIKEILDPRKKKYHKVFHALEDINLSIARGESYGIIGKNGSGKSTLLQIVAGVISQTSGAVNVSGRVASLLELGVGFDSESTGIENIATYFAINGVSRFEAAKKLDDVVRFADIGDFIYQPIKLYSSGMFVRLAFACASHIDPDIFIVDEALAVGDLRFTQKCFNRLREFVKGGGTLLFVSHDMGAVRSIANKAVWIDQGKIREMGSIRHVTDNYISYMIYGDNNVMAAHEYMSTRAMVSSITGASEPWTQIDQSNYTIFNGAEVLGVAIRAIDANQLQPGVFIGNEFIEYAIKIRCGVAINKPMVGVALLNEKAATVFHYNTNIYEQVMPDINVGDIYVFRLKFRLPNLARGKYNFYTNVVDGDYESNNSLCMLNGICEFEVVPNGQFGKLGGLVYIESPSFCADLLAT